MEGTLGTEVKLMICLLASLFTFYRKLIFVISCVSESKVVVFATITYKKSKLFFFPKLV